MAAELRDFQRVGTLSPARAFRTTGIRARYYAEIGAGGGLQARIGGLPADDG